MKKRVEAELISIAHRILKLKNKSEIDQLYKETQKLYEALTILKFHGDNYDLVKNSISSEEIEEKVAAFIETEEIISSVKVEAEIQEEEIILEKAEVAPEEIIPEEIIQEDPIVIGEIIIDEEDEDEEITTEDSSEEEESFMPSFELSFGEGKENLEEEIVAEKIEEKTTPSRQVTMDDVFGDHFREPIFVKPEDNVKEEIASVIEEQVPFTEESEQNSSLNDALNTTISIGLNDRIGFVKHLFNNSNEDYNRVLSQLNTFNSYTEAKTFINEMVIPDYNYWVGKEEYLERFMEIIEQKFK